MKEREFHIVRGRPKEEGPIFVDPALDPVALLDVIATLKPGDRLLAGPAPAWWERWLPWRRRQVRALERIAAALEQQLDVDR